MAFVKLVPRSTIHLNVCGMNWRRKLFVAWSSTRTNRKLGEPAAADAADDGSWAARGAPSVPIARATPAASSVKVAARIRRRRGTNTLRVGQL